MPISDNNPERRNLTILSLGIIIYYLSDGYLLSDEIKLKLINIGFHDKETLIWIVWLMLSWFLFRYRVTNKYSHGLILKDDPQRTNMDYAYVRKDQIKRKATHSSPELNKAWVHIDTNRIWYIRTRNVSWELRGAIGYIIRMHYLLKIAPFHRTTTDYYTPYILFIIAALLGVFHYIPNSVIQWTLALPLLAIASVEYMYLIS